MVMIENVKIKAWNTAEIGHIANAFASFCNYHFNVHNSRRGLRARFRKRFDTV